MIILDYLTVFFASKLLLAPVKPQVLKTKIVNLILSIITQEYPLLYMITNQFTLFQASSFYYPSTRTLKYLRHRRLIRDYPILSVIVPRYLLLAIIIQKVFTAT